MIFGCRINHRIDGNEHVTYNIIENNQLNLDQLLCNVLYKERQLKRDESLNVISPSTQYTSSFIPTTRYRGSGKGRGRGGRARGHSSNQGFNFSNLMNTTTFKVLLR